MSLLSWKTPASCLAPVFLSTGRSPLFGGTQQQSCPGKRLAVAEVAAVVAAATAFPITFSVASSVSFWMARCFPHAGRLVRSLLPVTQG
jgi:hypothetical protein